MGIEEEAARGDQRGCGAVDLTRAGRSAELVDGFADVTGASGCSLRERSAMGVHRDAAMYFDAATPEETELRTITNLLYKTMMTRISLCFDVTGSRGAVYKTELIAAKLVVLCLLTVC